MAIGANETARNACMNSIRDQIDGGVAPGAGKCRIYDGTRPVPGGAPTTLLAELDLSTPCAPDAVNGVLTFNAITGATALAGGLATWCRFVNSDGNFVCDGSVGATGSGAEMEFANPNFVVGGSVSASGSLTAPTA